MLRSRFHSRTQSSLARPTAQAADQHKRPVLYPRLVAAALVVGNVSRKVSLKSTNASLSKLTRDPTLSSLSVELREGHNHDSFRSGPN